MREVVVTPTSLERLAALLPVDRAERLRSTAEEARRAFGDRTVWHVSATASGGGVAEMLHTLLGYAISSGIDNRWLVLDGDPEFFAFTKKVHNMLHGVSAPGLGARELEHYRDVLAANIGHVTDRLNDGDLVMLHDPQTAGLAAGLRRAGLKVAWRCHVGRDTPNSSTEEAWNFLRSHLEDVDAFVFSRTAYAPLWTADRLHVIPPSIDPFSCKNVDITPVRAADVLHRVGLLSGPESGETVQFPRPDGTLVDVRAHRDHGGLVLDGVPPPRDARLVVQVSRWDRLKDMAGVMAGFALLPDDASRGVHLMLVGPDSGGVSDDPEGVAVVAECRELWSRLPGHVRERVHLVAVPMDDRDENAFIVNAVQRHARVIVQKSLAEGFGLTVTEAMWKSKPVLASRVGGIRDQITHGRDGLLLDDAGDLDAFAALLRTVLADDALARRLGDAARATVLENYVGDRHLERYADLFARLVSDDAAARGRT